MKLLIIKNYKTPSNILYPSFSLRVPMAYLIYRDSLVNATNSTTTVAKNLSPTLDRPALVMGPIVLVFIVVAIFICCYPGKRRVSLESSTCCCELPSQRLEQLNSQIKVEQYGTWSKKHIDDENGSINVASFCPVWYVSSSSLRLLA